MLSAKIIGLTLAISLRVSAQTTLDEFVGKNLLASDYPLAARLRLEKLTGQVPKGDLVPPAPWRVFRFARREETRYIVVMGEQLSIIPGGTSACIQLFDGDAKKIAGWCFLTGWRNTLQAVSAEFSPSLDAYVVVIRTAHLINGPDVAKQYFAVRKDQLRLIRLEDSDGAARQNEYVMPDYEIGVPPEATTANEWVRLLESSDRTEVLSALMFLGGRHVVELLWRSLPGVHESNYASLFETILSDGRIPELITRLASSDDPWIREEAKLAARDPRNRPFTF